MSSVLSGKRGMFFSTVLLLMRRSLSSADQTHPRRVFHKSGIENEEPYPDDADPLRLPYCGDLTAVASVFSSAPSRTRSLLLRRKM